MFGVDSSQLFSSFRCASFLVSVEGFIFSNVFMFLGGVWLEFYFRLCRGSVYCVRGPGTFNGLRVPCADGPSSFPLQLFSSRVLQIVLRGKKVKAKTPLTQIKAVPFINHTAFD